MSLIPQEARAVLVAIRPVRKLRLRRLRNVPRARRGETGGQTWALTPPWCCLHPALGACSLSGQHKMVSGEVLIVKRVFERVLLKRYHFLIYGTGSQPE